MEKGDFAMAISPGPLNSIKKGLQAVFGTRKEDAKKMGSMPIVQIIRIDNTIADGCFGALTLNGRAFCLTLERPWMNNRANVSCIHAGTYLMKKVKSHDFGITYEVIDVESRDGILFHWGNWVSDTKGCILVGESYASLQGTNYPLGKRGITNSLNTHKKFMTALSGSETCQLIIKEAI